MSTPESLAIFRGLSRLTVREWARALLPVLVWAALVWLIGGLERVPGNRDVNMKLDKLAHLAIYGALGLLCGRAWRFFGGRGVAAVLLALGLALGAADEWRQQRLADRSASAADWLADAAGVVAGFFLAASSARQRQRT